MITIQRLLKLMLLAAPIRIIGKKRNEVFFCCEALRGLIYPFKYAPSAERAHQYATFISLRGVSSSQASQPLNGVLGLDKSLIGRVVIARDSHILFLDKDGLYQLKIATKDITERKFLNSEDDVRPNLPPSDLEH